MKHSVHAYQQQFMLMLCVCNHLSVFVIHLINVLLHRIHFLLSIISFNHSFCLNKPRTTVLDRGSMSDRPRCHAHARWAPPLPLDSSRRTHANDSDNTRTLCYRKDVCAMHLTTHRQYAHGLLLESPFVPSSIDCWAVRAKIRQTRPSWWP